ncbi:MAG: valine--tRNA ligase [Rhodovibrionaceae bacterium]|nr:valine--tRNA ligase [Rhodovibrionaceae bacterium]
MLEKTYRPAEVEKKHYDRWREAGAFHADPDTAAKPYTIMMPPPNVTGSLHMGHALTFTLQDVLIRAHRMRGRDALWQPGMDHAGIATQMVVERQLAEEGIHRRDIGREKFLEKVWEWKAHSGGTIMNQLTHLGASADWSRERFTMDDGLSLAVRKVFVDLYRQNLVYRDKRLVNWDPKLHTAISDLEVQQQEVNGHLWHFRYPVEGEPDTYVVVATTRPETMLGDTAVAVHPEDERYTDLVGKNVILPLVGRRIPIVADDWADPETGSGAVKITPAHDFNDFEVGRRHDLEMVNVLDSNAVINDNAPEAYRGLDRYEARRRVVADLEAEGLLEKVEDHVHTVPHGDRSGVAIEPWLTDQWYVDAATLAKPAIEAVENGDTVFVPQQWANVYFEWMRNIQPWCVSRQIWWGHQIPAWYGPDGEIFVEMDDAAAKAAAEAHYGKPVELTRDPDVLDTWFSSALWPFSTLGWPEETPELARYYPGDVLVTRFDIIFFWVARMMMMGLHFMGEVPFHTVYIHALVRDAYGQKMSKSKGNIIDPLDLIESYGCDALRFTLVALSAQGRDIKLAESRVEGYRNFATKLWNAARYCLMNGAERNPRFHPEIARQTVNRWVAAKTARMIREVESAVDAYKFNDAASALYRFVWGEFCDWYIEFTKPILQGDDAEAAAETRACMAWTLDRILRTLHPFMPFVTEELWQHLGEPGQELIITADWPTTYEGLIDEDAEDEIDWVARVIGEVRAVRSEMNVPPSAEVSLWLREAGEHTKTRLETHATLIKRLARLSEIRITDDAAPKGSAQVLIGEATGAIPLAEVIDLEQEQARLQKEAAKLQSEIDKAEKKLSNDQFLSKAPIEIVEEQKERRSEASQALAKLNQALERLAGA